MNRLHQITAATACAIASSVWAQTPPTYYACVSTKDGTMRLAGQSEACGKDQYKIQWNQVGPQGPAGAQGIPGPQGPAGPPGTAGQRFAADNAWEVSVPQGPPSVWRTFNIPSEVGKIYLVTFGTTFENYDTAVGCQAQIMSDGDVPFTPAIATVPPRPTPENYGYANASASFVLQGDGTPRTANILLATNCVNVFARFPYYIMTVLNQ